MKTKIAFIICALSLGVSACGTGIKKVTLDESDMPSWTEKSELSWEDDGKLFFKAKQTVLGSHRINGCYELALLDAKETLLRSMAEEIKGEISQADMDLNEQAEIVLGRVRTSRWEGKVYGQKKEEQAFRRFAIVKGESQSDERIDCYVLTSISKADYDKTKDGVINKLIAIDPRVKDAVVRRQINFFSDNKVDSKKEESREPASNKE